MTERDFRADMASAVEEFKQRARDPRKKEYTRYERLVRKAKIQSYAEAYVVLGDPKADLKLRRAVAAILCRVTHFESRRKSAGGLDRRTLAGPVLRAIQTKDSSLRYSAIWLAGILRLKRAVPLLIEIAKNDKRPGVRQEAIRALDFIDDPRSTDALIQFATDHNDEKYVRIFAIIALCSLAYPTDTQRIGAVLQNIMVDATDDTQIRAEAAEWLAHMGIAETLPSYIQLLSDPDVELRFWAAFGLVTMGRSMDMASAMPLIDRTVAYDVEVLPRWWSVASEIMPALEGYWYWALGGCEGDDWCGGRAMLISPLLEYDDYRRAGQRLNTETHTYEFTHIEQATTLAIDPAMFAKQILERWPDAKINVRDPQPAALILDWWMQGDERPLMGGLHRNGYWIFLSGDEAETLPFILWLRGLITPEHTLRFYEWADPGIEINAELGEIGFSEAERRAREASNELARQAEAELNYWAKEQT